MMMRRKRRGWQSNEGVSLLEAMAALFVLSVGLMGLMKMFLVAMDTTKEVHEQDIAMRAIQNEMETLRAHGRIEESTDSNERPFVSVTPELQRLFDAKSSVQVRPYADNGAALREITLRVVWTSRHGRRIEKKATTLMRAKE